MHSSRRHEGGRAVIIRSLTVVYLAVHTLLLEQDARYMPEETRPPQPSVQLEY